MGGANVVKSPDFIQTAGGKNGVSLSVASSLPTAPDFFDSSPGHFRRLLANAIVVMAATKPAYDPMKTVEGMFNGSVTRIAYAMKDPLNYAHSTRAVLVETAKKFQDALDDCEIQILDAKWYLEHKLAQNRARREAKAREDSAASAKRKRDEVEGAQGKPQETDQENATKRVKTGELEKSAPSQQPQKQKEPSQPQLPKAPVAAPSAKIQVSPKAAKKPSVPKPVEKPPAPTKPKVKKSQSPAMPPAKVPEKPPEQPAVPETSAIQQNVEDYPKATPQDMSAGGNEDFSFVSMFGEPTADMMAGAGNDMNFDMSNLDDGFDAAAVQDASLNSLLPGLESYANQAGDDSFNLPGTTNMVSRGDTGTGVSGPADNNQPPSLNPNDFSLPALGPNEFDELLNSSDMNFDNSVNFVDSGMMNLGGMDNMDNMDNMENMENMDFDFDSMFK